MVASFTIKNYPLSDAIQVQSHAYHHIYILVFQIFQFCCVFVPKSACNSMRKPTAFRTNNFQSSPYFISMYLENTFCILLSIPLSYKTMNIYGRQSNTTLKDFNTQKATCFG
jgi:hypothetical protein